LAATHNKKKLDLDAAKVRKEGIEQAKRQGEEDYDNELPNLERKITLLGNEVTLLKCTLNIYELTYKPEKTGAEKQMLVDLWQNLERTFQTDKMKKHLDHVWVQLKNDPGYKQKAH
jgi:hypothetical protein